MVVKLRYFNHTAEFNDELRVFTSTSPHYAALLNRTIELWRLTYRIDSSNDFSLSLARQLEEEGYGTLFAYDPSDVPEEGRIY